jgi:group I intron endonuclease
VKPIVFIAYIITNKVNGRAYIGITSRGVRQRWNEHLYDARVRRIMLISRAISKHGPQNFTIRVLASAYDWRAICKLEQELISQHGTRAPNGYNVSEGGEGPFGIKRSAESIERSAAKHRGKPCHPNTRAAAIRTHLGSKRTLAHRMRISSAKIGVPRSAETISKIKASWALRRASGEFKTSRPYEHSRKVI